MRAPAATATRIAWLLVLTKCRRFPSTPLPGGKGSPRTWRTLSAVIPVAGSRPDASSATIRAKPVEVESQKIGSSAGPRR